MATTASLLCIGLNLTCSLTRGLLTSRNIRASVVITDMVLYDSGYLAAELGVMYGKMSVFSLEIVSSTPLDVDSGVITNDALLTYNHD